ncbi:TolC family protein [Hyphobacterium sp.]|uniref:TolC family protein n=1 Tax=Hyphobacterium sp. TaxID=2004662 RepID=UPI003BA87A16
MLVQILALAASFAVVADNELRPLSLPEAVLIAQAANEPSSSVFDARADALVQQGAAADTLPDPVFSAGIANVPLTDLDPNREPMTQARIGVRQMFPRGDTRRLIREQRTAEARAMQASRNMADRQITLSVREAWLEIFYLDQSADLTRERLAVVQDLAEVALSAYSTGRNNSHDVTRVDLEESILEARLIDIERSRDQAVADLSRFVTLPAARRPLPDVLPVLPPVPEREAALERLAGHPMIQSHNARIDARELGIDLALQEYRPAWGVEAGYGLRGSRSDIASIGVSVQMPLFSRDRQDETVASARNLRRAAELERAATLLDMAQRLERELAQLNRLGESARLYEETVLPRARETAESVLLAYQNESADFAELVRSELAHLDAELALLRIEVDMLLAQSRILYLTGDIQ